MCPLCLTEQTHMEEKMIPEKQCHRKLYFDNVDNDAAQIQSLGLQQSKTSVRYKPIQITRDDIANLFEDGDADRAFRVIAMTINQFERRISALEQKK